MLFIVLCRLNMDKFIRVLIKIAQARHDHQQNKNDQPQTGHHCSMGIPEPVQQKTNQKTCDSHCQKPCELLR